MCLVFAERRVLVIIVRIAMNAFLDKRTEVMQTLLSMIEPTENERGCLSFQAFRDLEDKNGFHLMETLEDLERYLRSARFSVLLGTRSLLYDPPRIEIHTVSHSQGMETINTIRGK
jgi:quinol monooxygenase YgiN